MGSGEGADVIVVENGEEVVSLRTTLALSLVSFFGSMVFWSQNITGNAVLEFGMGFLATSSFYSHTNSLCSLTSLWHFWFCV